MNSLSRHADACQHPLVNQKQSRRSRNKFAITFIVGAVMLTHVSIRSQPVLGNSTIGQHTRHIIELFRELEAGYASGLVNYDNRKRDMLLETYPEQAIAALQVFIETIARHDKPINILGSYSNDDEMLLTVHSSYYRELIYNLEHAIHHMAYIRIGIEHLGNILLPKDFGVAPATNRYRKACAQ